MPIEIVMPKLGLNMTEGILVSWLKAEGDRVFKEEPIFIVETDKASVDALSPSDGILEKIIVSEGSTVPVRTVVGILKVNNEFNNLNSEGYENKNEPNRQTLLNRESDVLTPVPETDSGFLPAKTDRIVASPAAKRLARENNVDLKKISGSGLDGRIRSSDIIKAIDEQKSTAVKEKPAVIASPVAKKMAKEFNIDLNAVQSTGEGGRITREDVERHVAQKEEEASTEKQALEDTTKYPPGRLVSMNKVRKVIADRMTTSLQTMAQYTLHSEINVSNLVENRERLKLESEQRGGVVPGYNAIFVSIVAWSLREHPLLNAMKIDEGVLLLEGVHIGVAVDTSEGLIVIVIKDADKKSIIDIHRELNEKAERALRGVNTIDDVSGSTFTITNLGHLGIDSFTPVINPPEVGILGFGRIREHLVMKEGKMNQQHVIAVSLTVDHRIVDGAPAARFLNTLSNLVTNFYLP
jgi:pyruvate dehydrogenase E2 component (dihydrolipoamide acetyltransferase)